MIMTMMMKIVNMYAEMTGNLVASKLLIAAITYLVAAGS